MRIKAEQMEDLKEAYDFGHMSTGTKKLNPFHLERDEWEKKCSEAWLLGFEDAAIGEYNHV